MFCHDKIREYSPTRGLGRSSWLRLCPNDADLLPHCSVGYMDFVFLCQAQNLWVTHEGKATDNSQQNQVTVRRLHADCVCRGNCPAALPSKSVQNTSQLLSLHPSLPTACDVGWIILELSGILQGCTIFVGQHREPVCRNEQEIWLDSILKVSSHQNDSVSLWMSCYTAKMGN